MKAPEMDLFFSEKREEEVPSNLSEDIKVKGAERITFTFHSKERHTNLKYRTCKTMDEVTIDFLLLRL